MIEVRSLLAQPYTAISVALLQLMFRSELNFTSVKLAPEKSVFSKLVPSKSAPVRSASEKLAPLNIASLNRLFERLAFVKSAPSKFASIKIDPFIGPGRFLSSQGE